MISLLDSLSQRARMLAATLILGLFAFVIVAPVGLGLAALSSAWQNQNTAQETTAQIEARLQQFEGRRAALAQDYAITQAQIDAYLDGPATHAAFSARAAELAEALRAGGLAVSGESRILERRQPDGVMLLSADLSIAGSLADALAVLSKAEFADLRTEAASFAAQSAVGQIRGTLRLTQHHAGASLEEGVGDES